MPATSDIVHVVILYARREVRMSGTGLAAQLGVILGARVGVLDNRGDGRAGGMSIDNTGDDVGGVGLAAFGRGRVRGRRLRKACSCSWSTAMPAGMPSSEQPMAGECDWPKMLEMQMLPKVEDMLFLLECDLAAQQTEGSKKSA